MTSTKLCKREGGFTLVELAIVLVIIGLLIGGVLKGRELIENARITSVIQQVHPFEVALASFRTNYDALPGDMTDATTRINNCTGDCAATTTGANDNGAIDAPLNSWTGSYVWQLANSEHRNMMIQLASAQLITGVDPRGNSGQVKFGVDAPLARTGGGFHTIGVDLPANGGVPSFRNISVILRGTAQTNGNAAVDAGGSAALSSRQAGQIDRRMDDGRPGFGRVIAFGSAGSTGCDFANAQQQYIEVTPRGDAKDCNLVIGIE